MTANTTYKLNSEASESSIKPSATATVTAQKAARDNQVGAGVLSAKTGQLDLPDSLVFTPVAPVEKTTAMFNGAENRVNAGNDTTNSTAAKKPDQREVHPFTWMKKDSTELSATESDLHKDAGQPDKLSTDEQKMDREVQHTYEDLHVVKDRHLAHDANYRKDWKAAYSQLASVQADLHTLEEHPSGSTQSTKEMQQLSKDETNLQSKLERLYEPALESHKPGDPSPKPGDPSPKPGDPPPKPGDPPPKPGDPSQKSAVGSDNMILNVNSVPELKKAIASGLKFGTVRLWDNGVKINQLMNADGTMNKNSWNNLQELVDTAHAAGKKVMYTFGETRNAKGECLPPTDAQVRTVTEELTKWSAQQKAEGKPGIDTYELWNEPSYKGFWTGSPEQLAHTTGIINQIIRQNDPTAKVASPADSFWGKNAAPWAAEYFAAYKKEYGLNSSTFDQIDFHGYNFQNQAPEQILNDISQMKQVEAQFGLQGTPLVDSEDSFGLNSWIPDDKTRADDLARKAILSEFSGVTPAWYTNDKYGGLDSQTIKDEQTVYGWMDGAKLKKLTQNGDIYTAIMEKDGRQEEIAWTTSAQPVDFTPGSQYSNYQSLFGESGSADGTIELTGTPMLLD